MERGREGEGGRGEGGRGRDGGREGERGRGREGEGGRGERGREGAIGGFSYVESCDLGGGGVQYSWGFSRVAFLEVFKLA